MAQVFPLGEDIVSQAGYLGLRGGLIHYPLGKLGHDRPRSVQQT
jgi:hypothetical protein